mgnify:CR=1 FL=1
MSDSLTYWESQDFGEETEEKISKDVQEIIELFRLLSVENKVKCRRIIAQENIF